MATDEEPELVEDSPVLGGNDPGVGETGGGVEDEQTLPGVPAAGSEETSVPPMSGDGRTRGQTETIPAESAQSGGSCGSDCGCSTKDPSTADGKRAIADGAGADAAGGTPTNVNENGELGDI